MTTIPKGQAGDFRETLALKTVASGGHTPCGSSPPEPPPTAFVQRRMKMEKKKFLISKIGRDEISSNPAYKPTLRGCAERSIASSE